MIGFFPELYPDELLYSACSRYHARASYRSKESTGRDLFGIARVKVAIDLPCNLDSLMAALPFNHEYTADKFIDDHTLLPIYGPFIPPQRLKRLREDMRGSNGGAVHGRIGILTSNITLDFLRFCPLCVESDRAKFDETYWHRLHKAPGVEVCHIHKVFLEKSSVHSRRRANPDAFITAEQVVFSVPIRKLNCGEREHEACLRIATDMAWLLDRQSLTVDPRTHRERYLRVLIEKGFSTYFGMVKIHNLIDALISYYSPRFLERIRCGLNKKYTWLHRLVHTNNRAQHPLQHLLLMQFLDCTPANFFGLPVERLPFGKGPWPCLNRASDHYGQALVTDCHLTATQRLRKPRGIFSCDCGFTYYRIGPDLSEKSRHEMSGYVTFGKVWEDNLKKLYEAVLILVSKFLKL